MKKPINVTGNIEVSGDCAYYRPVGKVTLEQGAELVDQAIVLRARSRPAKAAHQLH